MLEKDGRPMIEVTRMDQKKILINPALIEIVEETPDTVVTLSTGRKLIVKESRKEILQLIRGGDEMSMNG